MANKSQKGIDLAALRAASRLNQSEFWGKFGITQSCGSRYENGHKMSMPIPVVSG
jgi:hypothetical protein